MPLVVCRLPEFHEVVDYHQKMFIQYLKNIIPTKVKKYFITSHDLENNVEKYLKEETSVNGLKEYLFRNMSKNKLMEKLGNYISK